MLYRPFLRMWKAMTYYLFKLRFTSAVHFGNSLSAVSLPASGMTFCADRLFSALCQAAARRAPEAPRQLCELARSRRLKLSDAFPWKGERLYLPRPCLEAGAVRDTDAADRKVMKKVSYLPLEQYPAYLRSLSGGAAIDPKTLLVRFGEETTVTRAAVADGEDALPYAVGQYRFDEGCGLYFLMGLEDSAGFAALAETIRQIGIGGIGGKVSSGYGGFTVETTCPVAELGSPQAKLLAGALDAPEAALWVSLTASLPKEKELDAALDGALYQVIRRGGFVQASGLAGAHKKQEQFFLAAGSTFRRTYDGDVYDVAPKGCPHPVYRYAAPMFLGVNQSWLTTD